MLDKENEILLKRLQEQASEIAALKGETAEAQLRMELALVKEKSDRLQKMLFGASSEKRGATAKGRKEGRKSAARAQKTQQELPIVPVRVTLASGEDLCSACGNQLAPMAGQTEDSERVTVIQREFVVQRIEQQKYSCSCGVGVVTAPALLALIPGGRYSVEFAVHVSVDKYLMHLPLDRRRRSMMRSGLQLHCSSLWDQINALAALHEASYDRLRDYILGADVIGADETWWRLMKNRPSKRWWVWSMTVPDAIWYGIAPSRSAKTAAGFICDFQGTIVCDAYKAYETLARQSPDIRLALCWSHARRKFVEAEPHYPQCAEAIDLIGQLFALERETADPALLVGDEKLAATDRRLQLRSDRAPPILENLRN